ncbi:hypothetical protein MSMAS_2787 [Methanosarcina mazei S-6]|uniref:Uncharacterized protein n=2 Tax=Methanosarcina mazei TaxID=2209 RepID=A0A0E3RIR0_METMZ|nr:hypothetical protein MSMAS_2787 [Methanosarcina mazei S-6]
MLSSLMLSSNSISSTTTAFPMISHVMVSVISPVVIMFMFSMFPNTSVCACTATIGRARHNTNRKTINFIFILYPPYTSPVLWTDCNHRV